MSRKLYSGSILVLGLVQLIESIAFSIPFSYFPNYAISLGASVASIGVFTSSFMLSMALLSPKIGGLSDRIGRKKIILLGLLGDVVLGVVTGFAQNWVWLLAIRAMNGAVSAAAMLPAEALLIDTVKQDKRGEVIGFVMMMGMLGRTLGPVFGGAIQAMAHTFGFALVDSYRVPYFVDSVLAAIALVLVKYCIEEPPHTGTIPGVSSIANPRMGERLSRSIKILLVTSFITGIGVGFIMPTSVLFYIDKFGIEPVEIGFIISVTGLFGLIASWFAGRMSDRVGRKPIIALGGFAARISSLALPFTLHINQAVIIMALRSLGFNVFMPAMRALRADSVPKESRGRIFGMFTTAFTTGDIIGPILGTWLYSLYRFETFNLAGIQIPGYGIPFIIYSLLGIIAIIPILIFVNPRLKSE
jgi:DHA1 family multidrug resistance protein-like MFS transporter